MASVYCKVNFYLSKKKRKKVVHKNVSQSYNKVTLNLLILHTTNKLQSKIDFFLHSWGNFNSVCQNNILHCMLVAQNNNYFSFGLNQLFILFFYMSMIFLKLKVYLVLTLLIHIYNFTRNMYYILLHFLLTQNSSLPIPTTSTTTSKTSITPTILTSTTLTTSTGRDIYINRQIVLYCLQSLSYHVYQVTDTELYQQIDWQKDRQFYTAYSPYLPMHTR